MGLFSKKTIVCEQCGKEYEARITMGIHLCSDCLNRKMQKEAAVLGYVDYARELSLPSYTENQLDEIQKRRTEILEKYKMEDGISRSELHEASEKYRRLSEEEVRNILVRISNSSISSTLGAAYNDYFFVPTLFDKMIVDTEDIFAVGYTKNKDIKVEKQEVILCAVFTNDPYIPVFPMVYLGQLGGFDFSKSKKGRESVKELFELICPNLTYPVDDLKNLKREIKGAEPVKGNIEKKDMLQYISKAELGVGIFNTKQLSDTLLPGSSEMLDEYGYIQEDQINVILKMDKTLNRNFWNKMIQKLSK